MVSTSKPPEVTVTVLKKQKLPKSSVDWNDVHLPIDILLLTVEDCEFLSCLSHLKPGFYKSCHKDLGYVYFGVLGDDQTTWLRIALIKCNKGSSVPGGSVVVVKNAVELLRPKAVFCVGHCSSLKGREAKLGDVVVSAKLITYAPTKVLASGTQERGVSVPLNKHLLNLIRSAGEGWEAPLKDPRQLEVTVHRDGVILSGPEEVASSERCKDLLSRFPEAIAIEMEGEGLYTAAHDLEVEWIIIKGVSHYADEDESVKDSWRLFASIMAASLTANILSDSMVFRCWPHYGGGYAEQRPHEQPPRALPSASPLGPAACNVRIKLGRPSNDELEELSLKIADKWDALGRRLGFDRAMLIAFDRDYDKLFDKAFNMLMDWKQKEGSAATYQTIYDALCHPFVDCRGLAEHICCV